MHLHFSNSDIMKDKIIIGQRGVLTLPAKLRKKLGSRQVWITSDYAREEARRNIRTKRAAWANGFDPIMENIDVVPSVDRLLEVIIVAKDHRRQAGLRPSFSENHKRRYHLHPSPVHTRIVGDASLKTNRLIGFLSFIF